MLVLYATDLLFTTKVSATARAASAPLTVVRGLASLHERLAVTVGATNGGAPALVIVDLDAEEAIEAVEAAARSLPRPRVLAYVSHVRADLAAAARTAGADQVMARSAFVADLDAIVRSAAAPHGPR